jgi:hypothetical protein
MIAPQGVKNFRQSNFSGLTGVKIAAGTQHQASRG